MKVVNICILDNLEEIDIENDNVNVSVEVEDGNIYQLSFATPKYLQFVMDTKKMNYCEPSPPFSIVSKLTPENIEQAVKDLAEDDPNGYWLKVYHFSGWQGAIDESIFDQLKAKASEESKKLDKELDEDELAELSAKIDVFLNRPAVKPITKKAVIPKISTNTGLMRDAKRDLKRSEWE